MTHLEFDTYKELVDYAYDLVKLKLVINDCKTQFGGQCLIGSQPRSLHAKLIKVIDDEMKQIIKQQENI